MTGDQGPTFDGPVDEKSGDQSDGVRLTVKSRVAWLTLARPASRNALTDEVCLALDEYLGRIDRSSSIDVVVLSGDGPTFCAGGDRRVVSDLASTDPTKRRWMARRWEDMFRHLEDLEQPTVARLQGAAIGGGALLALACDLRIADSTFSLRLPEVQMGQFLMASGNARLAREVGPARARDLLLTGRSIDAATAERWGVVSRVTDEGQLDNAVAEVCETLLAVPRPVAGMVRRSIMAATISTDTSWADGVLATQPEPPSA